jgi:heat shock protein HslJ
MNQLKFILIFSILLLSACNQSSKKDKNTSTENLPSANNSKTSLDWNGVYKGILPCADCEGIETIIKLNKDFSYTKKLKYLGKEETFSISKGKFAWEDNGNIITLEEDKPNAYQVGENQLFALEVNNQRITGDLQELYILKKLSEEDLLFETYWKLVKLNNENIPQTENKNQEAHMLFIKKDTIVFGSGGCNQFRGRFELDALNNQLSFQPMATTMMACDNSETEDKFFKTLEKISQYEIKNDSLKLFDYNKTGLAKFVESENPSED